MHDIVEICTIASESTLTIWNRECDIEITVAVGSLVSLTSDFDRHTIFDAFGYIDGLSGFFFEFSFTVTVATLLDHPLSCAAT